mgnify:CR=1 FL=1
MSIKELINNVISEIDNIKKTPLDFTHTSNVPCIDDRELTFEQGKTKGGECIETCVLYVDIRDSVKLNEENANEPVVIDNINKIEIYTADSEDILVIEGGYLELGLIDTMKDLFVNFIGAIVYSILGYLYIKNRDDYKFAERFIPRLKKKNT